MENQQPFIEQAPPKGSRYAPISAWGYLGMSLLLAIPVVGLVLTIVWACGGAKNQNRRNYARAIILAYVIMVVLALVCYFVFGISYADIMTAASQYTVA